MTTRFTPARMALVVAVWSVPALLSAAQAYVYDALEGSPLSPWRALLSEGAPWLFWVAITPPLFALVRRAPIRRPVTLRSIALYGVVFLGCVVGHTAVYTVAYKLLSSSPNAALPTLTLFARSMLAWLWLLVFIFAAVIGIAHWLEFAHRERARELQTAALSAQLAQAQLNALRMQLHPHFLFNTLNTIAMLVREQNAEVAVRLISQLGDVLRQLLGSAAIHEVALRDEIAFVKRYLDIEEVRFEDRLRVSWNIAPDTLDARVPNLVLQPLVENALRHGIARRDAAGRLDISAASEGESLVLSVRDDGPGLAPALPDAMHGGLGISNTRARLDRLYGDAAALRMANAHDGGAVVTVTLPLRPAAS